MLSELEKMLNGEYADITDPQLRSMAISAQRAANRLNRLIPTDRRYRKRLQKLIPGVPGSAFIIPPFFCDYGSHIFLGENVFINMNCCFLDGGGIHIGRNTLIGPSVQLYTPQHPMDHRERRKPVERSMAIEIGEDCWLGGGVVVCPGVRIGDRCVIGAGSVVTRDIPDDSVAVGNPATVIRRSAE